MSGTVLVVIAQGDKRLALGDRVYNYGTGQYLVASIDLPVTGPVIDAVRGHPALSFGMTLEPATIAELLLAVGPGPDAVRRHRPPGNRGQRRPRRAARPHRPAVVAPARPATGRRALVPLVKREILWRLVNGEQGDVVAQLGLADSNLNHMTRAVQWIRENYTRPFRVEEVAQLSGMSVSAFHRNFQAMTGMTPIQFQKHIRLQAARLLLANRPNDVTGVGHRVGYDSPSQFSREYRRQFGAPPSLDALRMRAVAGPAAAAQPQKVVSTKRIV
jgi:AraC-like DNA-binding protein